MRVEVIRVPARLSRLGIDELYYDVAPVNWHKRAKHLQERRWRKMQHHVPVHHLVTNKGASHYES